MIVKIMSGWLVIFRGKLLKYSTYKHTLFGKQEGVCLGCKIPSHEYLMARLKERSKGLV